MCVCVCISFWCLCVCVNIPLSLCKIREPSGDGPFPYNLFLKFLLLIVLFVVVFFSFCILHIWWSGDFQIIFLSRLPFSIDVLRLQMYATAQCFVHKLQGSNLGYQGFIQWTIYMESLYLYLSLPLCMCVWTINHGTQMT